MSDINLVVLAYGGEAVDALYERVRTEVGDVHLAGDAHAPRRLMDAILDGARIGRLL